MSQTANLTTEQVVPQSPQNPNTQPGAQERRTAQDRGREAPADPRELSPPWKLAETTQGNADLGAPRARPQSAKLKHPSPVKQAW